MRYTKGKWVASYKDTWSVDYTLSPIILAVMKKFREQSHKDYFGYPCCLKEDFNLPENFDATVDIWFSGNVEFNLQEYFIDWLNPTPEENTLWTLETGLEPIETYVEQMEKMMKEFK